MTKAEFQILERMIIDLEVKLKQHTTEVVQEAMKTIGEQFEVYEADYKRTKNDHELRILRLEQTTS